MEEPTYFHLSIIVFEAFWKKHEMIVMAPNDISLPVMLIHNVSEHLVCFLVRSKLGLEAPSCCKAVFLRKPEIVEKWP